MYVVMWLSENQKDENLNENLFEIGACKYIYIIIETIGGIFLWIRAIQCSERYDEKKGCHWFIGDLCFVNSGNKAFIFDKNRASMNSKSMQKRMKCKQKENDWMVNRQSSKNVKIGTGMIQSSENGNLGARLENKGC